ncbi:hypothetical protein FQN50_006816 [Emmonsiellopsis sp. PD_5]|nr:hypothetical protein FQN50_006816 [Emmonsiellopsis sp. PD_5]
MRRMKHKIKSTLFPSNPPAKKLPNRTDIWELFIFMDNHIKRKGKKITIMLDAESHDALYSPRLPMTGTPIPHITFFIDDHDDPNSHQPQLELLNEAAEYAVEKMGNRFSSDGLLRPNTPKDKLRGILIEEVNKQQDRTRFKGDALVVADPPWRYTFCSKFKEMVEKEREGDRGLAKSYLLRAVRASSGPNPKYEEITKWGDEYEAFESLHLGESDMRSLVTELNCSQLEFDDTGLIQVPFMYWGPAREVRNGAGNCRTTPARAHRRQRAGTQDDIVIGNHHSTLAPSPKTQRARIQDDIGLRPLTGRRGSNRAHAIPKNRSSFRLRTEPETHPMYEPFWTGYIFDHDSYYRDYNSWYIGGSRGGL